MGWRIRSHSRRESRLTVCPGRSDRACFLFPLSPSSPPSIRDSTFLYGTHRSKQVQFVGQYEPQGVTCRLEVGGPADLDRMLIKSENATISIPELEFEILGSNTPCLGLTRGDVSSVRDVLLTSITNLQMNQHERAPETAEAIESFLTELQKLTEGQQPFTLVMDDPSGNSYIETTGDGDAALTVEQYERSVRQALAIGLPVQAELEENTLESVAEEDELDD
ncbi:hypothetical protein ACKKBF_B20640 [Auxenochlorella protothecoides x Auxenochlorella symbiontica]